MLEPLIAAHVWQQGATVQYVPLDDAGDCDLRTRVIRVSDELTPVEGRCTIMHELGHLAMGHIMTGDADADAVMERLADDWAAERLITDVELQWALARGRDRREVAEMLRVDMGTLNARLSPAMVDVDTVGRLVPGQRTLRLVVSG